MLDLEGLHHHRVHASLKGGALSRRVLPRSYFSALSFPAISYALLAISYGSWYLPARVTGSGSATLHYHLHLHVVSLPPSSWAGVPMARVGARWRHPTGVDCVVGGTPVD